MKLLNEYEYKIPKIWFYDIKGVQDVATLKEIEIAKKLSNLRAKLFLESRAYIRQSLALLFDLNPLEIPIIANPGKPLELPEGMGNISLSHCKDAIVVAWHKEKIGIDIERTDRHFDYEKIANKYFKKNLDNDINKLDQNLILNQWCATEAAIKWDKGKLARDIKEWHYSSKNKKLFHKKKNLNLKFQQINFHKWTIAFALEDNFCLNSTIICSSKNI